MQRRIILTQGNINHHHFYLRRCADIIPDGGIGGNSKEDLGQIFTVAFEPGETIETDVAGDKMILRNRAAVRAFFNITDAQAGDFVIVTSIGNRTIQIKLEKV
jgi:hypothetical protein